MTSGISMPARGCCLDLPAACYWRRIGNIAITNVGNLLAMGDIPLLLLTVPLTALAVAGLSNAYNMIDGIDGLAASTITLPLSVLYLLALQAGHPMANTLLLMILPLLVFLLFNLGPNNRLLPKIFLGDAGSVTLGFLVTASLVYFSQGDNALILPVTALWLVTVPLMDMLATMLRRLRQGRKLMSGRPLPPAPYPDGYGPRPAANPDSDGGLRDIVRHHWPGTGAHT